MWLAASSALCVFVCVCVCKWAEGQAHKHWCVTVFSLCFSHFHADKEDFRSDFKVPPFQDCVLSFLGFSDEEKVNMEERTLKHGKSLPFWCLCHGLEAPLSPETAWADPVVKALLCGCNPVFRTSQRPWSEFAFTHFIRPSRLLGGSYLEVGDERCTHMVVEENSVKELPSFPSRKLFAVKQEVGVRFPNLATTLVWCLSVTATVCSFSDKHSPLSIASFEL